MITIRAKKYKTILIDPPWKYGRSWDGGSKKSALSEKYQKSIPMPYKEMTVNEIQELPITNLMDYDCDVYLWVTQKYLPDAFQILKNWNLKYCQTLTWCKNPMGKGQGGLYCPTTEFLLLGRCGKMPKYDRIDSTWWQVKRQMKHSKKPDFFQDIIETVSDTPRLEMFARRQKKGWDVYGDEVNNSISIYDHKVNCKPVGHIRK